MTYKRSDIADILGISVRTFQRWIKAGKIPVSRYSRLTKSDIEILDKYLKSSILAYLK